MAINVERIERHTRIAEAIEEMFNNYIEAENVFSPDSPLMELITPETVMLHPNRGGEFKMADLFAKLSEGNGGGAGNAERAAYVDLMPDFGIYDFKAWPSENGIAFHYRAGGHTREGDFPGGHVEAGEWLDVWELDFLWLNDEGKLDRWEVFVAGPLFDRMCQLALGIGMFDGTPEDYGQATIEAASKL